MFLEMNIGLKFKTHFLLSILLYCALMIHKLITCGRLGLHSLTGGLKPTSRFSDFCPHPQQIWALEASILGVPKIAQKTGPH
jgi:hypothetical protein